MHDSRGEGEHVVDGDPVLVDDAVGAGAVGVGDAPVEVGDQGRAIVESWNKTALFDVEPAEDGMMIIIFVVFLWKVELPREVFCFRDDVVDCQREVSSTPRHHRGGPTHGIHSNTQFYRKTTKPKKCKKRLLEGLSQGSNLGPLAPKASMLPLHHRAALEAIVE